MVVGEDEGRNLVENRDLACIVCEIIANAIDLPLYHTKEARCIRICIHVQNLVIAPSF